MKQDSKKRVALATFYTLFVVMLLMGTRCESRVHLTTPERDAKHIAELAETVHSEAELRAVEKLATEYEIAYRKSYGGAKALYFKSLYEPVPDTVSHFSFLCITNLVGFVITLALFFSELFSSVLVGGEIRHYIFENHHILARGINQFA